MKGTKAMAEVEILVKVVLTDTWGSASPLSQVYKQAADSSTLMLRNKIIGSDRNIQIIGEPKVRAIVFEEK